MKRLFLVFFILTVTVSVFGYTDISRSWSLAIDNKTEEVNLPFYKRNHVGKMEVTRKVTIEKKEALFLFLGKIDDEDEVYFNGENIGGIPMKWYSKYDYKSFYFIDRVYFIPERIVKQGENEIKIKITNYFGGGGFHGKEFYIYGEREFQERYLKQVSSRIDGSNIPYFLLCGIFLTVAISYFMDFIMYKKKKETMFFGILMLVFSLFSIVEMPQRDMIIPFSSYYISKLDFSLMILILVVTLHFVHQFFDLKNKILLISMNSLNLTALAAILILRDLDTVYAVFNNWILFLILQLIVYIVYLNFSKKREEHSFVIAGLTIWFVSIIYDILYFYRLVDVFGKYVSMYGEIIFAIILILATTGKYYGEKRKLDADSEELEKKIAEKSALLEKTNSMLNSSLDELSKKEEQLIRSEKFAILGEMAGEITHEIKNPLSAILTNVQVMKMDMELFPESDLRTDVADSLEIVEEAAKQAKNIIANILNYARMEGAEAKKFELSQAVYAAVNILKKDLEKNRINLKLNLDEKLIINGKSGELIQVILNLLINAKDALTETEFSGRQILIRSYMKDKMALLEIADNGKGMSEEEKKRIFEPYYTTKESGKGTGLGMTISYGILKKHNAKIEIESEELKGTKFIIKFPSEEE